MRRSRPITRTVIMTGVKEESEQQEKKKNNSRLIKIRRDAAHLYESLKSIVLFRSCLFQIQFPAHQVIT